MTDEELKAIHARVLHPGGTRDRPSTDRAALWVYACELRAELASARTTIAFRSGEFAELRAENAKLRKQIEFLELVVRQGPLPTTVLCAAVGSDDWTECATPHAAKETK